MSFQMKCPEDCQCFHDQQWSANVVQCSNVSKVPSLLPMDVTSLHLERNNLTRLTQTMFLGRSRLKSIMLEQSSIVEIENGTFSGLDHLEVIDLGHNQLKQLFGFEFSGVVSLRELYLHHNQLVTIEAHTFKHLSQLSVLRLDGNLLIEFPIWELSANQYLSSLTLSSNWWNCECNFVRKFRMFIDTLGNGVVKDARQIACNSDHDKRIGQASCHAVLPNHHFFAIDTTESPYTVTVILSTLGVLLFLSLLVFVAVWFKDKARLWLYSRYGIRIEFNQCIKECEESSYLFDALVLYSNKDNEPYVSEFCQNLEPTYRLCLLHRDLSGIYTSEAFKSAVSASKRHIVLLSRSFLATEWQHFQEHLPDYQKLILIKLDLENNDTEDTDDQAFRKFLSNSKTLTWDSQHFWTAVKYFLPDPPRLPTKEGGAELDVSGVWTFNEGSANCPRPVKKKCAMHSTQSSINDSGVYDATRSELQIMAPTRSCGTNAVNNHQRSSSALVETIQRVENQHRHQRSKSYLHSDAGSPANRAAKMQRPAGAQSNYSSPPSILLQLAAASPDLLSSLNATLTTPLEASSTTPSSDVKMLSPVMKATKLKDGHHQRSSSLVADLSRNSPGATPRTTHSKFIGNRNPHRRSSSVLDPKTSCNLVLSSSNPRLLEPNLSSSNPRLLEPNLSGSNPRLREHHLTTSNPRLLASSHNHTRSASMLESSVRETPKLSYPNHAPFSGEASAIRLEDLDSRKILNMSTSQLHRLASNQKMAPKGVVSYHHQRSSSTPYEGFVL